MSLGIEIIGIKSKTATDGIKEQIIALCDEIKIRIPDELERFNADYEMRLLNIWNGVCKIEALEGIKPYQDPGMPYPTTIHGCEIDLETMQKLGIKILRMKIYY